MKHIFLLVLLASCSAFPWKAAEDLIEGEVQTAEKVFQDLSSESLQNPHSTIDAIEFHFPMLNF